MNALCDSGPDLSRLRSTIRGAVQGVGFRPFVFRLATEMGLDGWVNNSPQGVFIEAEAEKPKLVAFLQRLESEKPPRSFIQSLETTWLDPVGYTGFEIRPSDEGGEKTAFVMPDLATCPECLAEVFDPDNRRYRYPFTNCTNCGPRFSIIEALPYDRVNTSMKRFTMCAKCQSEYDDPLDRRFHAQPNACPVCGPHLEWWGPGGVVLASAAPYGHQQPVDPEQSSRQEALVEGVPTDLPEVLGAAVSAIRNGYVVAVKGLGGFHLMVRADAENAVRTLRERKHREEKPFALMFPTLDAARDICEVSALEERLLLSPEAPIVLLRRRKTPLNSAVCPAVAPGNPNLGIMLPYTPLHHLLMASLQFPVVATSGNLRDEPICTDEHEAIARLKGVADYFLVHNRPVVRHVDDSIVRVVLDRELVLRRARGYAPLPVQVRATHSLLRPEEASGLRDVPPGPVLGVGAHLKNTVALCVGQQVFLSQHIGDLETAQAYEAFRKVVADLQSLYHAQASVVMADSHPVYLSTQFARSLGPPCRSVQHHVAHVLSCMAENELEPPVLGVSWDGTGYGLDGTVWGGEFFHITPDSFQRVAHFRQFRLPGGERAVKEPRRSALGLLFETLGDAAFQQEDLAPIKTFSSNEKAALKKMIRRQINSPFTSSVGRLFDAVASLLGLRQQVHFEGQAAMELEFLLGDHLGCEPFDLQTEQSSTGIVLDWRPVVRSILQALRDAVAPSVVSARFHNMLAESVVLVAQRAGLQRVVLSGGCFQNRMLVEQTVRRLKQSGFRPYWHQRVPPNDGGICLGQVVAGLWWKV